MKSEVASIVSISLYLEPSKTVKSKLNYNLSKQIKTELLSKPTNLCSDWRQNQLNRFSLNKGRQQLAGHTGSYVYTILTLLAEDHCIAFIRQFFHGHKVDILVDDVFDANLSEGLGMTVGLVRHIA